MSQIKKIDRLQQIVSEEGLLFALMKSVAYTYRTVIRPLLPVLRYAQWNTVKVPPSVSPKIRLFDRFLPDSFHQTKELSASEGGEVKAHQSLTRQDDEVVIVGGGRGVTTVCAARQVQPSGKVTVFEGSQEHANILHDIINLNSVSELCTIRTEIVGSPVNIFGDKQSNTDRIPVSELPECDVLELDCEGSEVEILRDLDQQPRVIIVEMHPNNFDAKPDAVLSQLDTLGYTIKQRRTNTGDALTQDQLSQLLQLSKSESIQAPVVAATID